MPLERTVHDLSRVAVEEPFRLFNSGELSEILGVSREFVTDLRDAGAPFPGNMSRPEWVLEWLRDHPTFTRKNK